MTRFRLAAAALLLSLFPTFSPANAQDSCVSGREGRQVLETGRIVPFPAAAMRAGISPRDVQRVALCRAGPRYVYRVMIVQRSGGPRTITIPAN